MTYDEHDDAARKEAERLRPAYPVGIEGVPGERESSAYRVGFVAGAAWQRSNLAEHDRQEREKAWDEGSEAIRDHWLPSSAPDQNPYRAKQEPNVVEPEPTYEVLGGQGLRVIASGLSKSEAERVSREFEDKCARAGLTNPPGRIQREQTSSRAGASQAQGLDSDDSRRQP